MVYSRRGRWSDVLLFLRDDSRRVAFASKELSVTGLFGRVLRSFLLRADFMTNDRTTLSGFALTPPLLESMNINFAGLFACFLGGRRTLPCV
jgi:hypothetical protein